jgi:putative ABC transport system ATP-binding protein
MHMVESQGDDLIVLSEVVRRFQLADRRPLTALDHVSLRVRRATVVAVSGPSGSGKSTLLHLIGALDTPDEGAVVVNGQDLRRLSRHRQAEYRRHVGFIFQHFNLLPALTVLDNVTAPVLPYRTDFDKQARALELLTALGLESHARQLPSRLSGGEQQRVAIARALINRPSLILADEPTGNLDSRSGAAILDLLLELREQQQITVVMATHDVDVASRCDRMLRLVDGRVRDDLDMSSVSDPDATWRRLARLAPPGGESGRSSFPA